MGWQQKIDYVDVKVTLPPPVSKQIWDGEKFVPMRLYRIPYEPGFQQRNWLRQTYGAAGSYVNGHYWDYSQSGNFTVMDEKVYTWYQIKWGNK